MIEILRTRYKQIRIGHGGACELRTPEGTIVTEHPRGLDLFFAADPMRGEMFRAIVIGATWVAYGPFKGRPVVYERAGSEATETEALAAAIQVLDEICPCVTASP
jgi:hypothetical protein